MEGFSTEVCVAKEQFRPLMAKVWSSLALIEASSFYEQQIAHFIHSGRGYVVRRSKSIILSA